MNHDVKWREATKPDAVYMQTFTCTSARPKHGKDGVNVEHQVQAFFRQYAIKQTNRARDERLDGRLMIAEDSKGIAAAYAHRLLAPQEYPEELEIPVNCPVRDLCFLAVAERYRVTTGALYPEASAPGALADEAINEALWDIKVRAPDAPRIYVTGLVDYRNAASLRMLTRNHFDEISRGCPPPTVDNRLGRWMRILH
ncbi:hypothetical protein [Streptomyces sp. NBC_01751]|uniref:hypothetical protein n=1 Tax=Streptomyces sp. NBC_01751 TaxID=2975929 RepID=UPI002DD8FA8A|nr:hypothetical protein [Streptomyces sp. NBC_01751]WSD22090.1 hypothetical protein OHA26_00155 [Streptomyces sp. NBC_01751]WSD29886.1 hypothetical protein OHA26_44790 [Streptomyces sp. NBC_01751]